MAQGKDNAGTKYRLANTYESLWIASTSDWTGESVFDIQTAISGTQTNTNTIMGNQHVSPPGSLGSGGWGFYQPSYDFVNAHRVDANGLPLMDNSYQNAAPESKYVGNMVETDLSIF